VLVPCVLVLCAAVKSHSFDLAYEVYRHLSTSPCTGMNISTVDD
jgi:hypothetical protein